MDEDNLNVDEVVEGTEEQESDKKEEHKIPKHRFDEVNNKYKEYAELGLTPADIREMAAEYRALVEKDNARDDNAKPTKESKLDDAKRKELREGLLDIYPELAQIPGLIDDVKKTKVTATTAEHQQIAQMNERATELVTSLFEQEGFTKSKHGKLYDKLEDMIAKDIYADPKLSKRFFRGDLTVVKEVFKEYQEDVLSHVVKPAKPSTKDLSFLSGKKGLSLPASPLDDKVKAGKPLTREEQRELHNEVFSAMQGN